MTTNFKTLALARDIETAFKNHLGTDSFPTVEWPRVALALAHVIEQTGRVEHEPNGMVKMDSEEVRRLIEKLSELNRAVAELVGL